MAKKKQHGGKREGAGRKPHPEGRTVLVAATVPGPLVEKLDEIAATKGWNRSEAVTTAIRTFVNSKQAKS